MGEEKGRDGRRRERKGRHGNVLWKSISEVERGEDRYGPRKVHH